MKRTRILAALCSAVLACTAMTAGGISMQADAVGVLPAPYPEWMPTTYEKAVEFSNVYGRTHLEEDLLYMVFPFYGSSAEDYALNLTGTALNKLYEKTVTPPEDTFNPYSFQVFVFGSAAAGDAGISFRKEDSKQTEPKYTFTVDSDLKIEETDIYSWLPDCSYEFQRYREYHGKASAVNGYITYCLESSDGTAYEWRGIVDTNAPVNSFVSDCSAYYTEMLAGAKRSVIQVYTGTADGPVTITQHLIDDARPDLEPAETVEGKFWFFDDGKTALEPGDARFTVLDKDTGELFVPEDGTYLTITTDASYRNEEYGWVSTGPCYVLYSNPSVWKKEFVMLSHADSFNYWLSGTIDPVGPDDITLTKYDGEIYDIVFRVRIRASGDVNGDNVCTMADIITLQKWLRGETASLKSWRDADLNHDGRLDVRDFTLLKQKLLNVVPHCTLTLKTESSGYSVAGEPLKGGTWTTTYTLFEYESLYEVPFAKDGKSFSKQSPNSGDEPLIRILQINNSNIEVLLINREDGQCSKIELLPYDQPLDDICKTQNIVFDGLNSKYTLTFSDPVNAREWVPDDD